MSTLASKLFNLAEIFQGLAMVGGGAGARSWRLDVENGAEQRLAGRRLAASQRTSGDWRSPSA